MEVRADVSLASASTDALPQHLPEHSQQSTTNDGAMKTASEDVTPVAEAERSSMTDSAKPSAAESSPATVQEFLAGLNLTEYYQNFIDEGFDRMSSVLEVTEEDLTAMGVKRGHRRTIQRQIASIKGLPFSSILEIPRRKEGDAEGNPEERGRGSRVTQTNSNVIIFKGKQVVTGDDMEERSKRRYRRHPKPDLNAPDKPPSAYVTFSNGIREELKGTKSFSELARIVGERWKALDPVRKERLEVAAAKAKEQYHSSLAAYKTTSQYAAYQQYLAEFKARHGPQESASKDRSSKSSKPPTPPVTGSTSSSIPLKRPSSANTESYVPEDYSDTDSDGSVEMPSNEAFFAKQLDDARLKRRRESNGLASVSPVPSMMLSPGTGGPPLFTRPFGIDSITPTATLPSATPAISTTRSTLEPVELPDPPQA